MSRKLTVDDVVRYIDGEPMAYGSDDDLGMSEDDDFDIEPGNEYNCLTML